MNGSNRLMGCVSSRPTAFCEATGDGLVELERAAGDLVASAANEIVEALIGLRSRTCIIDGEAVACDDAGISSFDRLRHRNHDDCVFLYAFDLIELNGEDLRRNSLQVRKATLTSVIAKAGAGIRLNEHLECDDGEIVFRHACKLGLEGIVSKRKDSSYRSGRSSDWLKTKNPKAPAVRREAEEDWSKEKWRRR